VPQLVQDLIQSKVMRDFQPMAGARRLLERMQVHWVVMCQGLGLELPLAKVARQMAEAASSDNTLKPPPEKNSRKRRASLKKRKKPR
jgi:hypothetical protein